MISASRRQWHTLAICLILALFLGGLLPQAVRAEGPPDRPDIPDQNGSHSSNSDSTNGNTGRIILSTFPGAWTMVQWQDGNGRWHDVTGWRGQATGGSIAWTVEEKDFGTGPFRWVVAHPQSGRPAGASHSFFLPGAGDTLTVEVQGHWHQSQPQRPWPQRWRPTRSCTR